MKILFTVLVFVFSFIQGNVSYGQLAHDTAAKIDALFAGHAQDEPGGVLEITRHGKKIYRKVFGVTNLQNPTPITGETIFLAASVTKQFTAAGILLLVKAGKLALDDDVRKYIPELPDYGKVISIRQLLTHTSGLKDWRNITYITSWPNGYRVLNQNFALRYICEQKSLNYVPGERYSYTNSGYDMASVIIERVTGTSYQDFIEDQLLKPAGMLKSHINGAVEEIIRDKATGYNILENQYVKSYVLDETFGAAGLLTTASDLTNWNNYIFNSRIGKELAAIREERYVLNNGDTITYANGGVNVSFFNGVKEITHSGLLGGFRALCTYYPDKGLSVAYMSNNRTISTVELHENISEIFFGKVPETNLLKMVIANSNWQNESKKSTKETDKLNLDKKTGVYLNIADESDFLKLHNRNGDLMSYSALLKPEAKDVFTYASNIYQFLQGGDSVRLYRSGQINTYCRVESFTPEMNGFSAFTGNFFSDDADVSLEIKQKDNHLIAYRPAGDSVLLSPVFHLGNRYVFRGFDHGLRANYFFEKPGSGPVINLKISLPRAAGIPFYRTSK